MWQYNYDYLCHGVKGYKYIDRKMGKNGRWIYTYPGDNKPPTPKPEENPKISKAVGNAIKNVTNKISTSFNNALNDEDYKKYKDFAKDEDRLIGEYQLMRINLKNSNLNQGEREQLYRRMSEFKQRYGEAAVKAAEKQNESYDRAFKVKKGIDTLHKFSADRKERFAERKKDADDLESLINSYEELQSKYEKSPAGTQEKAQYQNEAKKVYDELKKMYYDLKINKYSDVDVKTSKSVLTQARRLKRKLLLNID